MFEPRRVGMRTRGGHGGHREISGGPANHAKNANVETAPKPGFLTEGRGRRAEISERRMANGEWRMANGRMGEW
jgi:hypothetical protein